MSKVPASSNGRYLYGRERDVDLRARPQAQSAWEARLEREARQRAEDRRTIVYGIVWGLVIIIALAAVLAAGGVPAR